MQKVKIITGSQASLTEKLGRQFDIAVIPYYLNYSDKSLKEGIDFKTEEFYKSLADIDNLPTSSPPSIGDIINVINNLVKNYKEFIIFTLSANYSQMYNTCVQASKQIKDASLHIVDSGGATAYQAMMAIIAARMAKKKESVNDILKMAAEFKDRGDEFCVLNTLKYLAKGGRIGRVKALMGSLLSIKPVIVHRDGITAPLAKARTNRQALIIIIETMKNRLQDYPGHEISVILQGVFMDEWLENVEKALNEQFKIKDLWYSRLSAITSIHFGPKSWSLTYYIE